jgi:Ca2+-transporting ATPase
LAVGWEELAFKEAKESLKKLDSSQKGLNNHEAKARLEKFGYNELSQEKKLHPFKIFLEQFNNFIIYVLFFAVAVSFFIGEFTDAIVILIILIANALLL